MFWGAFGSFGVSFAGVFGVLSKFRREFPHQLLEIQSFFGRNKRIVKFRSMTTQAPIVLISVVKHKLVVQENVRFDPFLLSCRRRNRMTIPNRRYLPKFSVRSLVHEKLR